MIIIDRKDDVGNLILFNFNYTRFLKIFSQNFDNDKNPKSKNYQTKLCSVFRFGYGACVNSEDAK